MTEDRAYRYIIVGGGLAGATAADGIREVDPDGGILILAHEVHLPYHRPPLTKKLWSGGQTVDEIFVHDEAYYREKKIDVQMGTMVTTLDPRGKAVRDLHGTTYRYEKLLLATGGAPRRLAIPGGDLDGVCYYRYLDDYRWLRPRAEEGTSAVVIGGGFIGSEIGAALAMNRVDVIMIFPSPYLCDRVLPPSLGEAIEARYREHGVVIYPLERPVSFHRDRGRFITTTEAGREIASNHLIVGIGIVPSVKLADDAGLAVDDGIIVDAYLRTSEPDIYAAGDNARFPYAALGIRTRIEHWDNAKDQGKVAGRNMAGGAEPFDDMPFFFSDLFEFGYEAVGDVDTRLRTFADWERENEKGVIYYLADRKVRGAMMCGVWGKVDDARELIRRGEELDDPESLRGRIR